MIYVCRVNALRTFVFIIKILMVQNNLDYVYKSWYNTHVDLCRIKEDISNDKILE